MEALNHLLVAAGVLSVFVGVVHSALGEILVFRCLRQGGLVPTVAAPPLRAGSIRILWATWHLASAFGFALGAILMHLATMDEPPVFVVHAIALAMCAGSLMVLVATRGKHPGWLGLLAVAVLSWLA